jgi:hypothetical protein
MAATPLDVHLLLNALNFLSMDLYRRTGAESPLIGHLADYIVSEHQVGVNARILEGQKVLQIPWASELQLCHARLQLQSALGGYSARLASQETVDATWVSPHSISGFLESFLSVLRDSRNRNFQFGISCSQSHPLVIELWCNRDRAEQHGASTSGSSLDLALDHAETTYRAKGGFEALDLLVLRRDAESWKVEFRERDAGGAAT